MKLPVDSMRPQLRKDLLSTLLLVIAFVLATLTRVLANVALTGASGGSSISADTAANAESPDWTTLGAIIIAEGANTDFETGIGVTLVLKAPGGFEFNTAVTPDITFAPGGNILSASVAINNPTTITVTLDVSNLVPLPAPDTLTMGSTTGIQVRPVSGTPLASGKHIHRPTSGGGGASIVGITASADGSGGSNFGDLTETAGEAAFVRVETLADGSGIVLPAQTVRAGNSVTGYAIIRDTFTNFIANGAADDWLLPIKTGAVVDEDLVPAVDNKSAVFTGRRTGTATIGATSGALAQNDSGTLTVVAGAATSLFVTLPNETFAEGIGNSGTVVPQTTGIPFTIRLTVVDNFTNIATTYSGSTTVNYGGPAGNPTYTTNVNFTAGLSPTNLATTLTQPETTRITATVSGLASVPSSTLIITSANTAPVIAPIASQTVYVDHPALYKLYVRDLETATNNLQLSFVSSRPALFPTENAVFHYFLFDADGPHWYLTLVPAFGQTGTATNTLIVSDGTSSTSADFVVTVSPPPPGAARFANTNAITIGEVGAATPYPSTNIVTGMSGVITNLTLTLSRIHHQWIKDLHMLLVGPSGQGMVVFSRVSSQFVTNVTTTLTDASPFQLPDQFELWSEQFKPTDMATTNGTFSDNNFPAPAPVGPYGSVSFSSSFTGLPANGTWSLYIYDDHAPSQGSIAGGWSLMIATSGGGTPPLKILSVTGGGTTNVVITWSAISNVTYRVQYQPDLNPTNWSNLSPDVTATNATASFTDHPGGAARRFYRVRTVP